MSIKFKRSPEYRFCSRLKYLQEGEATPFLLVGSRGRKGDLAKSSLARAQIVGKRAGRGKLAVTGRQTNIIVNRCRKTSIPCRFFRQPGRRGGRRKGEAIFAIPSQTSNRPGRIIYRSNCRK